MRAPGNRYNAGSRAIDHCSGAETARQQGSRPRYAQEQARARRWSGARLDRAAARRAQVRTRRKQGWSPEQLAGRRRRDAGRTGLAHETIDRFSYAQTTRPKPDRAGRHCLPRAKWRRGHRRRRGRPASLIHLRRPLAERPATATDRQPPGQWEADLMLFRTYGQAVLTLPERHSRRLLAVRPPGKAAAPSAQARARLLGPLPAPWRQTVTFDNGTEFAHQHERPARGLETGCCDTPAPWQKGGVENAIGRLRRGRPRKTDLATVAGARFTALVQLYNNTPRKCLGYRTPAEVFWNDVLHFQCESTFPPARE